MLNKNTHIMQLLSDDTMTILNNIIKLHPERIRQCHSNMAILHNSIYKPAKDFDSLAMDGPYGMQWCRYSVMSRHKDDALIVVLLLSVIELEFTPIVHSCIREHLELNLLIKLDKKNTTPYCVSGEDPMQLSLAKQDTKQLSIAKQDLNHFGDYFGCYTTAITKRVFSESAMSTKFYVHPREHKKIKSCAELISYLKSPSKPTADTICYVSLKSDTSEWGHANYIFWCSVNFTWILIEPHGINISKNSKIMRKCMAKAGYPQQRYFLPGPQMIINTPHCVLLGAIMCLQYQMCRDYKQVLCNLMDIEIIYNCIELFMSYATEEELTEIYSKPARFETDFLNQFR